MNTPKELPILFSAPMVRAILDGAKTQTRRIVKLPKSKHFEFRWDNARVDRGFRETGQYMHIEFRHRKDEWEGCADRVYCPYGQPGDRLYVRESYYQFGHWEPVAGQQTKGGKQKWCFIADYAPIYFEEPSMANVRKGRHHKDPSTPAWHKRLARFMPRSASRITLEVESVRAERLHDINWMDAKAEGVRTEDCPLSAEIGVDYVSGYKDLWESINGPGSWATGPWVWVITFKRIRP